MADEDKNGQPSDSSAAKAEGPQAAPESGREQLALLIAQLESQIATANEQKLRALAEAENSRKRALREVDETRRYAAQSLARDIVPVADNMRRALQAGTGTGTADQALATLRDGLAAMERAFLDALEKHAIRQIASIDVPFDPHRHQAMLQVENTGKAAGTVVQMLQPGYILHDRLLRPAMVAVAKGEPAKPEAAPSDAPAAEAPSTDVPPPAFDTTV